MTPDRHRWAVDQLDLTGAERVLEFGGGPGVATALVCERLTTGSVLAIDRSPVAVRRTSERNTEHIASGRLVVRQCSLADLDVPAGSFEVAFGINVNVFWTTTADAELAALRRALVPGGRLLIAYGTGPSDPDNRNAITTVLATVKAGGFARTTVLRGAHGSAVLARTP
ncbi:class I SAM-dependent methyltransferase [Phytoactinopolyspora halotolerans]|uniref:Class I SAM-dependent methyltransferase n=1 Tax=Phytoactinopolyspora halotolerans TaxID=1981512 RepID=A0A6L9S6I6_9ACTN|nr:class I SAM-dependent methyltransferase [Phytoactinopolyspora halotolerans]NEE00148.1 class I SAM-dependent methyltransferase [Phytoactinopolyspora halotolerans]